MTFSFVSMTHMSYLLTMYTYPITAIHHHSILFIFHILDVNKTLNKLISSYYKESLKRELLCPENVPSGTKLTADNKALTLETLLINVK